MIRVIHILCAPSTILAVNFPANLLRVLSFDIDSGMPPFAWFISAHYLSDFYPLIN
jgi:hypothetical protein